MIRLFPVLAGVLMLAAAFPVQAQKDIDWGVRGGVWFDGPDPLVGVEALWALTDRIYLNPNVEVIFTDTEEIVAINADAHYDLATGGNDFIWLGAGFAALLGNNDDLGANLLAGYGLDRKRYTPYAQLKVFIGDETESSLAVGIRF